MKATITEIYCKIDDMLTSLGHRDDPQVRISSAEVMTTAIVAARFFGGNHQLACAMLKDHGYIPNMVHFSRFNRRLHALPLSLWQSCLAILGENFKEQNSTQEYIIDSFPVPVCDNIRIAKSRIFPIRGEGKYRGPLSSKRRFFYGMRVHLLTTAQAKPVELVLAPGSMHDGSVFKLFSCDLPEGAIITGDKIYNDAAHEEHLLENAGIQLLPLRKKNMRKQYDPWIAVQLGRMRQRIETGFSCLTRYFPKHIHAVRPEGFILKILAFVLAYSLECS